MPARQEVGYGPYNGKHLHVEAEPEYERDFYFTDEKPIFHLQILNIGTEDFDDELIWFIGFPGGRETSGFCSVELKPNERRQYEAGGRLLGFPGTATLCLKIPSNLPVRGQTFDWENTPFHTLYTFEVYDRALYDKEQRNRRNTLMLLIASVVIAVITLGAVIATLIFTIEC